MKCRHCNSILDLKFLDLNTAPPSNSYLCHSQLNDPEKWFPLRVMACTNCWLVQTEDFNNAEDLFDENYAYFSSYSSTWLEHSKKYVKSSIDNLDLNSSSFVVEVASNDGYLLQYYNERAIPCLGIEPTHSTANSAREKGIDVIEEFFGYELGRKLAENGLSADLCIANNVLAHVPNVNDFVKGFVEILKPNGVVTFEFPHLFKLIDNCQFDTVYHEHFSYLSLTAVDRILKANGLQAFRVEELDTHGGSLRVYAQRTSTGVREIETSVGKILLKEVEAGMLKAGFYREFQYKADAIKYDLLNFLIRARGDGKIVCGYGAAAKGNTLLNYAGVHSDLIPWIVDLNPAKQNMYMPGSRIPIVTEQILKEKKPAYVLILPWNLSSEIMDQLSYIRRWGGQFVVPIPKLKLL